MRLGSVSPTEKERFPAGLPQPPNIRSQESSKQSRKKNLNASASNTASPDASSPASGKTNRGAASVAVDLADFSVIEPLEPVDVSQLPESSPEPMVSDFSDVDDVIAAFHGDQQSASLDRQRGLDSLQEFENSNQRELLLLPGGFTEGEQTHQVPGTQWNAAATARDQSRSGSSRLRSRTWLQLLLRPVDRLKAIFHRGNEKR